MIFTGDVAIAEGDFFRFDGFSEEFYDKPMCINLEGAVNSNGGKAENGVYNSMSGLKSLSVFNLTHPFCGNNHIHDIENGVLRTHNYFNKKGLSLVGAGMHERSVCKPAIVQSEEYRYAIFGYGWPVIGCMSLRAGKPGVNTFNSNNVLRQITKFSEQNKKLRIVVVIHGNYEFEQYPQPGHRKLALKLIDLGVYSVIFHHPHIVGPIERYKGRTIAYSLGNWAFSYAQFFNRRLIFPPSTYHQIAIELGEEDIVHHACFSPPVQVDYERSELVSSPELSLMAEFEGFNDTQYLQWFKANRHKRKFLPIYTSADRSVQNFIKDKFVYVRQKGINMAVKIGLKSLRR